MPNSEGTLASALNELTALGTEQDREQLAALLDRLDAARLRVLVVGEAKRGKSTLVNAMLGREVLPSGVTPLTAVTTTVRYGEDERAEVRFLDGHDEKHPLAALADLVTERGNPANRRGIAGVTVYLVTTFAVLNKADHLDVHGLAEAVEFTRRVLGEAGHTGTVYPMSARAALRSGDDGFIPFRADFVSYLSNRRETDLHTSAVAQARRIADSLLDEVRLTRRAAGIRVGDAAQRVEQFSTRLSEVTVHSHDALIVVDGESGRLLFALNDAADADGPRLGREITGQLKQVAEVEHRSVQQTVLVAIEEYLSMRETAEILADPAALRGLAEARESEQAGDVVYGTEAARALLAERRR